MLAIGVGMSERNVELVRSLTKSWNSVGDPSLHVYHADAEFDFSGWDFDIHGTFQGLPAIGEALGSLADTWEEMRVDPQEFIDAGDKVLFVGRFLARRRDTGLEVSDSGTCVFTFRDDKISRFDLYRDHASALADAGVKQAAGVSSRLPADSVNSAYRKTPR